MNNQVAFNMRVGNTVNFGVKMARSVREVMIRSR